MNLQTVVDSTTPATFQVAIQASDWPVVVTVNESHTGTCNDPVEEIECTLTVRHHADGINLISYVSTGDDGSKEYAEFATADTTRAAIDRVCDHLRRNNVGYWVDLATQFSEKWEGDLTGEFVQPASKAISTGLGNLGNGATPIPSNWVKSTALARKPRAYVQPTMPGPIQLRMRKVKAVPETVNDAPIPQSVIDGLKSLGKV
jgi:hypothetical protein